MSSGSARKTNAATLTVEGHRVKSVERELSANSEDAERASNPGEPAEADDSHASAPGTGRAERPADLELQSEFRRDYYCTTCRRLHFRDSKIGKAHEWFGETL